jgi:hypothetical protein
MGAVSVRRDTRRFVFHRWRLLEIPASVPLDPLRVWRERYGYLPPLGMGGVVGAHFQLGEGVRAVKITRPETLQVPDQVRNRLFSTIAAKHRAAEVRLARSGEGPNLKVADRLPRPLDRERVEEWPDDDARTRDWLVAEHAVNTGVFLTGSTGWDCASGSLDNAALFETVDEAEGFLASLTSPPPVLLRYRAAVISEADQRDSACIDGRAMPF